MKLFLLIQKDRWGHEYARAVVCAESSKDALQIDPDEYADDEDMGELIIEEIGDAEAHIDRGVVLVGFSAG